MVATIADIQEAVARGAAAQVSIDAALERIAADPTNAFTEVRSVAVAGTGPLSGVPLALKDLIDEQGRVTTAGSSFYRHQASRSATVVTRLESAGATIVGRTGLHEFAYGFSSENEWFGPVRNPWDRDLSPGGSSGGSAAAVGAGLVPGAIGTDTGGSVRVPAALCGIMGLKVSHGAVPITGVLPLAESLDTVGPLARTITDLYALFDVMVGFDDADPWSRRIATAVEVIEFGDLTVGVPRAWLAAVPTDPTISRAFGRFLDDLASLGVTVIDLEDDALIPSNHVVTISAAEAAGVHRAWFTDVEKAYGPDVEERLADAMEVTVDQLTEARRWQASMVQRFDTAFTVCDVLATPTVGSTRKQIGVDQITIDGRDHFYRPVLAGFTALVNQVWCPALSVPLAVDGAPPPSIQLIGRRGRDVDLLAIGRELERAGVIACAQPPHVVAD